MQADELYGGLPYMTNFTNKHNSQPTTSVIIAQLPRLRSNLPSEYYPKVPHSVGFQPVLRIVRLPNLM